MKEVAPEGMHSVTVYTIAPDTLAGGSWSDDRELYADRLLKLAEEVIPNLRSRAKVLTCTSSRPRNSEKLRT